MEGNRIQYFDISYSCYKLPSDTDILLELHMFNQLQMYE